MKLYLAGPLFTQAEQTWLRALKSEVEVLAKDLSCGIDVVWPGDLVSPEDIILTKIEWSKGRQDSRQLDDALHVAAVQLPKLDKQYLKKWAKELNITDELNNLLSNAEKLQD